MKNYPLTLQKKKNAMIGALIFTQRITMTFTTTSFLRNISLAFVLGLSAANVANAKEAKSGMFVGAGAGLGGFSYGLLNAEFVAGYQHYFPKEYNIAGKFRQGIRGYGSVGYSYGSDSGWGWDYSYHFFPITANVDWIIEFNPKEKFVWGAFAGIGLGFVAGISNYTDKDRWSGYDASYSTSSFGVAWGVQAGGSLTIENTHRIEAGLGVGNAIIGARYILML